MPKSEYAKFLNLLEREYRQNKRAEESRAAIYKALSNEGERKARWGAFVKSIDAAAALLRSAAARVKATGKQQLSPAEKFAALSDFRERVKAAILRGELTADEASRIEARLSALFSSKGIRQAAGKITAVPMPAPGGALQ